MRHRYYLEYFFDEAIRTLDLILYYDIIILTCLTSIIIRHVI